MSNAERKTNLVPVIKQTEATFNELAQRHNVPAFTFAREAEFALQILKQNEYLADVACSNQDSLKAAIINVAAVGLSLSPFEKEAYLVPRKVRGRMQVCLDPSFKGLQNLATGRGALVWIKAVLVYAKDEFEYLGANKEPYHKAKNFFGDRGGVIGGYCMAKMPTGDLLVDFMSIKDIHKIRDRSDSWKAHKADASKPTPWATDEEEMSKKTLIKRASKSWPKSVASETLRHALELTSDTEDMDLTPPTLGEPDKPDPRRDTGLQIIREHLEVLDREESKYIEHLNRATNRKIEKLDDLTNLEIDQQVTYLEGLINAQAARIEAHRAGKEKPA